jgi:CRISPR-associated endoribonuclease Cas6
MRLHFHLSANQEPVPFDYQHFLTGAFNKWLEDNRQHDEISLYSLSWLYQGFARNGALEFTNGARWFISLHDVSLVSRIVDNVLIRPDVCCGMRVTKIVQQDTPRFSGYYAFKVGSPVLAKQVSARFDHSFRNARTKLVKIKGIANRASLCPVIVEGTPEAVQFAWNVGIGHGTGSGFGCLL